MPEDLARREALKAELEAARKRLEDEAKVRAAPEQGDYGRQGCRARKGRRKGR